jgi:dethiobiotin synthetase
MPGLFVTGTGTDVGKTYVAVALIRHLRQRGCTVRALKPLVTGITSEMTSVSDCAQLLRALDEQVTAATLEAVSPWRYRAPLGPATAAALEGKYVDFNAVAAFTVQALRTPSAQYTLVEGLGGVMVPLDDERTLIDLMCLAAVPVIVVAGTYLGSLSHTLSAVDALSVRGIPIAAVIVNESSESTVKLDQTVSALRPFVERLGIRLSPLPRNPTRQEITTMCEAVFPLLVFPSSK